MKQIRSCWISTSLRISGMCLWLVIIICQKFSSKTKNVGCWMVREKWPGMTRPNINQLFAHKRRLVLSTTSNLLYYVKHFLCKHLSSHRSRPKMKKWSLKLLSGEMCWRTALGKCSAEKKKIAQISIIILGENKNPGDDCDSRKTVETLELAARDIWIRRNILRVGCF